MSNGAKRKREDEDRASVHSDKRQKLLDSRKKLPIWTRQTDIRKALQEHSVLVLSGETGSGKSTQIPQFLLDESWCLGKIAVTQPRRVAAISLARRVADEMGTLLGGKNGKVGYSVRFDENTGPATRIKFLTEGMLLQEMLKDVELKQYSCVVVDEVHERSVDVDLILGFLKQILETNTRRKDKPLKVVVMSATADVEGIKRFFEQPGAEEVESKNSATSTKVTTCQVEGRQYPVKLHYLDRATENIFDEVMLRVFKIHREEPLPGDILVFLTGAETIETLRKMCDEFAETLGKNVKDLPKMLVLPLYAALSQAAQQRIFERAPPFTRKLILSTNIAETSVTVPGVRYIVDAGKVKIKQYRSKIGLESLLIKPISKSSADQRKGRAGREAPGQCYRLFTKDAYDALEQDAKPEIQRCDLSNAVLKMKARGVQDVAGFPFLTPPYKEAMQKSILQLHQLGCLDGKLNITEIGRQVARLPLTPPLGRVLIEAAKSERDCLLEVIDIVAAFDVENIWLPTETEEAREKAEEARAQLRRRQGDHSTHLAAVRAYAEENADRKRWCKDHMISHKSMQTVMDVRKQLRSQCKHLLSTAEATERDTIDEATAENILKCFMVGFPNNIARLCPDKSYKTLAGNHTVSIFPGSVLHGQRLRKAIIFNDFVYTKKPYARKVSAIELGWLGDVGLV
ncbi:P-loop containing nucleoside triphosphate hydrolase [Lecanosticta acicola]|uniref:RNA helicase n=1 Tax=Lecanosticta acicola TaxID=111012 RepID=A0AAI8YX14_9PEZI|nr:P-loop containing nucleoside triphosphate hydrolase [Lecanosticta acicola]